MDYTHIVVPNSDEIIDETDQYDVNLKDVQDISGIGQVHYSLKLSGSGTLIQDDGQLLMRDQASGIYYLHDYIPKSFHGKAKPEDVSVASEIWAFKGRSKRAFLRFDRELFYAVAGIIRENQLTDVGLTAVPSSAQGKPYPMLLIIEDIVRRIKDISKTRTLSFRVFDDGPLLRRESSIKKAHQGERATYDEQLASLRCLENGLWNRRPAYILMDDVATTGTSLDACRDLLVANGIKRSSIYRLVIAKTKWIK